MKTIQFLVALAVLSCSSCSDTSEPSSGHGLVEPENDLRQEGTQQISMVSVIALPRTYDGRKIRFVGYLVPNGDLTRVFLDKESAENSILDRAILLARNDDLPNTQRMFNGPPRYVSIVGMFSDSSLRARGTYKSNREIGSLQPTFPPSSITGDNEDTAVPKPSE